MFIQIFPAGDITHSLALRLLFLYRDFLCFLSTSAAKYCHSGGISNSTQKKKSMLDISLSTRTLLTHLRSHLARVDLPQVRSANPCRPLVSTSVVQGAGSGGRTRTRVCLSRQQDLEEPGGLFLPGPDNKRSVRTVFPRSLSLFHI